MISNQETCLTVEMIRCNKSIDTCCVIYNCGRHFMYPFLAVCIILAQVVRIVKILQLVCFFSFDKKNMKY